MSEVSLHKVWKSNDSSVYLEISAMWNDLNALPTGVDPNERAKQAIMVVRDREDKVVGVSTAVAETVPLFRNQMYVYRCLIHPSYRIPGLMQTLTSESIEVLESEYKQNDPKCIGVFARIESKLLRNDHMVHAKSGLTFAGYSPEGFPMKTYFFKGAKF